MHFKYVTACVSTNSTHVGYSVFKALWHNCMPHIRFMMQRTDMCALCENLRQQVQLALSEEEKVTAATDFIESAQEERMFYKSTTIYAKEEYDV